MPSATTHQPATAAGQNGSRSSSRWAVASTAKMTARARESANHTYQASLTSQDSSGVNSARPNTSPHKNDPRRLRPASATTSRAGPSTASGQTPNGGKAAKRASPPATEMRSAQPVPNPRNSPACPRAACAVPAFLVACSLPIGSGGAAPLWLAGAVPAAPCTSGSLILPPACSHGSLTGGRDHVTPADLGRSERLPAGICLDA